MLKGLPFGCPRFSFWEKKMILFNRLGITSPHFLRSSAGPFCFCMAVSIMVLLFLGGQSPVRAQEVPSSAKPEALERQLEKPPEPLTSPVIILPEQLKRPQAAGQKKTAFVLRGIALKGVTVYAQNQLVPLYVDKIGQTVTFSDLQKIAWAITGKYRNDGYILSRAVFPIQVVQQGRVRLRIYEGYFDAYHIDETDQTPKDRLAAYAKKIVSSRPLHISVLERYLLLMNDLPGVAVKSVIRPASGVPGAALLVLQVHRKPLAAAVEFDNRGSRFRGPYQLSLNGQANGFFKLDESFDLQVVAAGTTSDMGSASLIHKQPLGAEGLVAYISGTYSNLVPGDTLNSLDLDSRTYIFSLGLQYPWLRSRNRNLRLGLDLSARDSRTESAGLLFSQDCIRSLRLSATYDFRDSLKAVTLIRTTLSQGLPLLGASSEDDPNLSRVNGNTDYTKLSAYISRDQQLLSHLSLFGAAKFQYAFNTLLSAEEFAFGGANFGSAYDGSEITGDHGAAFRLEARWSLAGPIPGRGQLYIFYDYGCVWRHEPTRQSQVDASSTGFGFRLHIGQHISASLEIAKPLTRNVSAEGNSNFRAFFSLAWR